MGPEVRAYIMANPIQGSLENLDEDATASPPPPEGYWRVKFPRSAHLQPPLGVTPAKIFP